MDVEEDDVELLFLDQLNGLFPGVRRLDAVLLGLEPVRDGLQELRLVVHQQDVQWFVHGNLSLELFARSPVMFTYYTSTSRYCQRNFQEAGGTRCLTNLFSFLLQKRTLSVPGKRIMAGLRVLKA